MTIQLFTFDAGVIHTRGVRFINREGEVETRDMADPNHCYLVQHPQGLLMWDAGLPDAIPSMPGNVLTRGKYTFELKRTLQSQLLDAGFHADTVDILAFSHLQVDHGGNAALFPRSKVLLQAAEYAMAFGTEAEQWGYRRSDYECLTQQEVIQLEGDYDVFGDGKVILLSAPGHTPGHQVLYVDLDLPGPLILSGDLYYAAKDPLDGWLPEWNYDKEETWQTMARLEQFAVDHKARWVINHQP
ncbi:MAG: N-acyl homoserine lactonase family protein [Anaerolineaceae bacterium]|nr:N-acyl homoserine lactonase family protein [Anaerolineaceae bacterium]